jgi:hypothetical protein
MKIKRAVFEAVDSLRRRLLELRGGTNDLPPEYQILPQVIPFSIPHFQRYCKPGHKVLATRQRDCESWFEGFVERVERAIDTRTYLPICRMSDGEYQFAVGLQPPSRREPLPVRLYEHLRVLNHRLRNGGAFQAGAMDLYDSGSYSSKEWQDSKQRYGQLLRQISEKGILAMHFSFRPRPFQENAFPALAKWMERNRIHLSDQNYVPFYFVYAAVSGPARRWLLQGRRVLVVTGATGEKKQKIIAGLNKQNPGSIDWCPISSNRSLFDELDVSAWVYIVDIAVVGAGVGSPNILAQLEPLSIPCIDIGFILEVWADEQNKWRRAFCVSDHVSVPEGRYVKHFRRN